MSYTIGTYESAVEDGSPEYCDEIDSLDELEQAIIRAEDYGMSLTDLCVTKYEPTDDPNLSDFEVLGSLEELSWNM